MSYQAFDAGGYDDDDSSTVYFVSNKSVAPSETKKGKTSSRTAHKKDSGAKGVAKKLFDDYEPTGERITMAFIVDTLPSKKVVLNYFKQRIEELTAFDSDDEEEIE